jgi:drug/metabolite transporter (DMT)-like permease
LPQERSQAARAALPRPEALVIVEPATPPPLRTVVWTIAALLCFAANSLLCRLALAPKLIDPASFTLVRVLSAAAVLTACVCVRQQGWPRLLRASPRSVAALFGYLVFFSFAYTRLGASTGALVLIAGVQVTMFCIALYEGEGVTWLSWLGLGLACAGLFYLLVPGATSPDPLGAASMAVSGAAWGLFTLFARKLADPVEANATTLVWCALPAAVVSLVFLDDASGTPAGFALAIVSGAVATGLGYIVWYLAVRRLTVGQAAAVQLSLPAVTALGGVGLLGETLTLRLLIATAAMLAGIALVLTQQPRVRP